MSQTPEYGARQRRQPPFTEPPLDTILERMRALGLVVADRDVRRYHLALRTRGFVLLAGPTGVGKTRFAETYASASGAEVRSTPVLAHWSRDEDLLGRVIARGEETPDYVDTPESAFIRRAALAHEAAEAAGTAARPFHLILEDINRARIEHYLTRLLFALEMRAGGEDASIELGPGEFVPLAPNICLIGTVTDDPGNPELTRAILDRAQFVRLDVERESLAARIGDAAYASSLLEIWDAVGPAAPFAFRVLDDIEAYIQEATAIGVRWEEALDDQIQQKVLPRLPLSAPHTREALQRILDRTASRFPHSHAHIARLLGSTSA